MEPVRADATQTGAGDQAHRPTSLAVVLAGGAGSRFEGGGHKLAAVLGGRSILAHAVAAAVAAQIGDVIVVTGALRDPDLRDPKLGDLRDIVSVIHNPAWADGQSTSLQTAIAEAARRSVDAVVVGLGDQPGVTPEAWRLVADSESPIAVATYDGRRRNPVRLAADVWPLLPTEGDDGARSVIRMRPDLVEPIPCSGSPDDIDTLEDLEQWQSRSSTNSQ